MWYEASYIRSLEPFDQECHSLAPVRPLGFHKQPVPTRRLLQRGSLQMQEQQAVQVEASAAQVKVDVISLAVAKTPATKPTCLEHSIATASVASRSVSDAELGAGAN